MAKLGLRHVVQPVAIFLSATLYDLLHKHKGLGGTAGLLSSKSLLSRSSFLIGPFAVCIIPLCEFYKPKQPNRLSQLGSQW